MAYKRLGDFNITLPPGLIQTSVPTDAAVAASQATVKEIMSSPVTWIALGLLAILVLKGRR